MLQLVYIRKLHETLLMRLVFFKNWCYSCSKIGHFEQLCTLWHGSEKRHFVKSCPYVHTYKKLIFIPMIKWHCVHTWTSYWQQVLYNLEALLLMNFYQTCRLFFHRPQVLRGGQCSRIGPYLVNNTCYFWYYLII